MQTAADRGKARTGYQTYIDFPTVVGEHAGQVLAEFVLAMRHRLGLNQILSTIHPYPTFAEANKYAAGVWKKVHAPEGLLRWIACYHAWRLH